MTARAIVTGATGFLGQLTCAALERRGYEVIEVVRFNGQGTGKRRFCACEEIDRLPALLALLEACTPDLVIHLAGITRATSLSELYRVNTIYGVGLLEALAALGASTPIVLAGSAAEYGPEAYQSPRISENAICRPNVPYGITKYAQTLHALGLNNKVHCVIARLFNPIGPGMRNHLALGSFAAQIAAMGPQGGVLQTGDLSSKRDFTDAQSTVEVLIDIAKSGSARGEVVNVCSGHATSVRELVEAMISAAGKPIRLKTTSRSQGSTPGAASVVGDPGKLERLGLIPPSLITEELIERILEAAVI